MSVPPEVIAAFDTALPGHSAVEDWFGIGATGAHWRTTWRGLDVRAARLRGGGWCVNAHLADTIGGQGHDTDNDLATALRTATTKAAAVATRYAAKQRRAAERCMARADEAEAIAAQWGQS